MAELTSNPSPDVFGTKAGSKSCKSELAQGSAGNSPLNPLIYVRYRDHVIFKNILQPQSRHAVWDFIKEQKTKGKTIILTPIIWKKPRIFAIASA